MYQETICSSGPKTHMETRFDLKKLAHIFCCFLVGGLDKLDHFPIGDRGENEMTPPPRFF